MLVMVTQVVMTGVCVLVIDSAGRRSLLLLSLTCMASTSPLLASRPAECLHAQRFASLHIALSTALSLSMAARNSLRECSRSGRLLPRPLVLLLQRKGADLARARRAHGVHRCLFARTRCAAGRGSSTKAVAI